MTSDVSHWPVVTWVNIRRWVSYEQYVDLWNNYVQNVHKLAEALHEALRRALHGAFMDTLDGMRTFIAVAKQKSFTGGAKQLGISTKLASKYIAQLEQKHGACLLYTSDAADE